ncbi:hypothetical protein BVIRIDIS_16670 [Blastochloris viridis]|uniref:Uncharacterized protein n=1 Tax=Blastochloris viridis TaxID=1079 RepID=A0A0S4Q575_BLAVI|nr:hypothetical protein BVIRIDIS_16670 [Blastochloris viridis]
MTPKSLSRVSIHAPARGATKHPSCKCWRGRRFDPRPCARGDPARERRLCAGAVSIHAPARGATPGQRATTPWRRFRSTPLREGRRCRGDDDGGLDFVSIHAPARGATCPLLSGHVTDRFDPRPCARGDSRRRGYLDACAVSIHAPARGATRTLLSVLSRSAVSIHAPARGATWRPSAGWRSQSKFRSTPLREGRPIWPEQPHRLVPFRSTPLREGRRYR